MTLTSLGRVTVSTPGTPVTLSADLKQRVTRVVLQTAPGNSGKCYFGLTGLQKATLAGVSRVLGATDSYEVAAADGTDAIYLGQLAVDADVAGEGVLVSYWTV